MPEARHAFRLHRSLVVALPPSVQEHIEVERGETLYFYVVRKKEVVLTKDAKRAGGHPEGLALQRELRAARAEVLRLQQRNEARDRSLYAEGYNVGYLKAREALMQPHGRSAEGARRRMLYAHVFPEAARAEARIRRKRTRRVEQTAAPDQGPPPDPRSPSVHPGEALAPGGEAPQASPLEA